MLLPQGFRYQTRIGIRYGDVDVLGHVNNAKYLTYLEQSRVGYARDLRLWDGGQSNTGIILARVEIDFRAPIALDDGEATVWTRVSRLGGKSFDMEHVIAVDRGGQTILAAQAKSIAVVYDYERNATTEIPESWRSAVKTYEGLE